jgi:hypothetical protein
VKTGMASTCRRGVPVRERSAGPASAARPLPHLQNNLRGHSRGVELFLERRSVNKLSGWVSYSYGVARYRDAATNLSFYGDFDQRHTFNTYATYRLKPTLNISAKYRYGSNFPAPAFLFVTDASVTLPDQRNQSRLPFYSRLDLRANKAFNFDRWKLTLWRSAERPGVRTCGKNPVDTINTRMSFDKKRDVPKAADCRNKSRNSKEGSVDPQAAAVPPVRGYKPTGLANWGHHPLTEGQPQAAGVVHRTFYCRCICFMCSAMFPDGRRRRKKTAVDG